MNRFASLLLVLLFAFPAFANSAGSIAIAGQFTDSIPPVITCPPNVTVNIPAAVCWSPYPYNVTATDNEPGVTVVQTAGLGSNDLFPVGVTLNTFVATDAAGLTATCAFSVAVNDDAVVLNCLGAAVIELDADCQAAISSEELLDPEFSPCLYHFPVEIDRTEPFGDGPWTAPIVGAADRGLTYMARVVNVFTGEACQVFIDVADSLPPVLTCTNFTLPCGLLNAQLSPAFLADSLAIPGAFPEITDNCGTPTAAPTYTDTLTTVACNPGDDLTATLKRTWSAADDAGNVGKCVQTISLRRMFDAVEFPAHSTTVCTAPDYTTMTHGRPFYSLNDRAFTIDGACDITVQSFDTLQPQCGTGVRLLRTWKVTDTCRPLSAANPVQHVQFIDLVDTTAITLVCPSELTVALPATNCRVTYDLPDVIVSDDCSPVSSVTAQWTASGVAQARTGTLTNFPGNNPVLFDTLAVFNAEANFPVGVTTITFTATNGCGQAATCSTVVTIGDITPVTAVCRPALTVALDSAGALVLPALAIDGGSTGPCGQISYRVRRVAGNSCQDSALYHPAVEFCCDDIGDTITVAMRIYGLLLPPGSVAPTFATGLFSECLAQIRLLDTLPPSCVPPADVTISCRDLDPALSYGDPEGFSCQVDSVAIEADYAAFDSLCPSGVIGRVFHLFNDSTGATGSCTQYITVTPATDYFVRFPEDIIVPNCSADGLYGTPELNTYLCGDFELSYVDSIADIPNGCYGIERIWRVINRCHYDSTQSLTVVPNPEAAVGPTVARPGTTGAWSPSMLALTPSLPQLIDYSTFWDSLSNGYQYIQHIAVVDTAAPALVCPPTALTVGDSTTNDTLLWHAPQWLDPLHGTNDLCETPTELTFAASDLCAGADLDVRYELFLDLDGDGTPETVVDSDAPQTPGTVNFGNATPGGQAEARVFDQRPVPTEDQYRFALQLTDTTGAQGEPVRQAAIRWNTENDSLGFVASQLPHGTHFVKWYAVDHCGNADSCVYAFTIGDAQPPVVQCAPGLTANLLPPGLIMLSISDFYTSVGDNCTPTAQLLLSTRKAGAGTGFPLDGNGAPVTSLTFTCADDGPGSHMVEVWAQDGAGNTGVCQVVLLLAENGGVDCNPFVGFDFGGTIETETGMPVVDAHIEFQTTGIPTPPTLYDATDADGAFLFANAVPFGTTTSVTVTPSKLLNPLNGVSTLDLVLISRHILGLDTLDSPYKMIAADANGSGSVTTFDIVELRKLILGLYDTLPNAPSWRFVPADYVFPDSANPFVPLYPQSIVRDSVSASASDFDFIGMKTGDVNNSVDPLQLAGTDDRGGQPIEFRADDRAVRVGDVLDVPFTVNEPLLGFQFTFEANGLEVLGIQPGDGMSSDNFALFLPNDVLTVSWNAVEPAQPTFTLRLRAWSEGTLSGMLALNGSKTAAEAYTADGRTRDVALWLPGAPAAAEAQPELYQNEPNPFTGATTIAFSLPAAMPAIVTVYDVDGRTVFSQAGHYSQGRHAVRVELPRLESGTVLFYKLETERGTLVKKMVGQ